MSTAYPKNKLLSFEFLQKKNFQNSKISKRYGIKKQNSQRTILERISFSLHKALGISIVYFENIIKTMSTPKVVMRDMLVAMRDMLKF